jgi:hypothetical protein
MVLILWCKENEAGGWLAYEHGEYINCVLFCGVAVRILQYDRRRVRFAGLILCAPRIARTGEICENASQ